jgi:FkbM family methyltransferase
LNRILDERVRGWVLAGEGAAFCQRFHIANTWLWRLPISVDWHEMAACYEIRDTDGAGGTCPEGRHIFVARRERVFRYRRGVRDRLQRLARKYFIDRLQFSDGDVVIDCGANVGEIGLFLKDKANIRYHAFEPSEPEAAACDINVYDGQSLTQRQALWNEAGVLTFFENNATGDSSLIEPPLHTGETRVSTTTITAEIERLRIDRVHVLKVEGEGAEPEILEGAQAILGSVAYCTVDCGPERGKAEAHVIPPVCNFMLGHGFEVVDVNLERQIFFFRNATLTTP